MPERTIQYQQLEHKADTGLLIKSPSWERLYIDAALALTDMRVPLQWIKDNEKKAAKVSADEKDSLLVKWLNEILFLFEKEQFLCRRIVFKNFDLKTIDATLFGERYEPARHGTFSEIKAATYHQLEIGESNDPVPTFFAKVFLDL